jgi:hypothetical protein
MQSAAGGVTSAQSGDRNDSHQAIVSGIASLIERVQASMKLIESAIAREASVGGEEVTANVVTLDDVTPRYLRARAALDTCQAGLGLALHVLRDAGAQKPGTGEPADGADRPVRLTAGA